MRTNIDLNDELIKEAMRLSGCTTKKATVEEALRILVQLKKQERLKQLRGKFRWQGDLEAMRADR